ncbi:methyltransferase [Candidatus Planktophila limnetica]|uniref:Methyltransferase n=1 Tax=Candidatus Planktophila limnetica TaxID=573600 RepID=A0A249LGM9_9ACTN|nr:class I SAM-dependent methyltransferase [Candidatus Planktophila limnetica]ASY28271.1 methyltransferase [Candidatus Planktophila limnetica]
MTNRGQNFCRSCSSPLGDVVLSLGVQPLSNALPPQSFQGDDAKFPLDFRVCPICSLGQIGEYVSPSEIFSEYTYFSSTSSTWLKHAKTFAQAAFKKLQLNQNDLVVEIASNDGYLLQYFQELNCSVLGIEPASNVADFANNRGITTRAEFFGTECAKNLIAKGEIPKLVIGNNVLAHVPDINDFMNGLTLLAQQGAVISIEAPSMLTMLRDNLFDTIYHEHFSYLSATALSFLAKQHNLNLFDVETLDTHGGSYRYWLSSSSTFAKPAVEEFKSQEFEFGIGEELVHKEFASRSTSAIENFSDWVKDQKIPLVGYGAAAKATVLLNAAEVESRNFLSVIDNSLSKQGRYIPGCRIPITSPKEVLSDTQGNVVIFPWNISMEIAFSIRNDFPKFIGELWVALPELRRLQ